MRPSVWPPPRSLATTSGISVDVFSWPYLDVSVQAVPFVRLFDSTHDAQVLLERVPPFGNPRIYRIFAPPRGLSQLVTSFIACESLGIHHTPFSTFYRSGVNSQKGRHRVAHTFSCKLSHRESLPSAELPFLRFRFQHVKNRLPSSLPRRLCGTPGERSPDWPSSIVPAGSCAGLRYIWFP